ncbi:MAG TPA: PH domain-containing protein [Erysipelothrix sp.]|nr:PH domain-containing protein [Erysipelothrix sp.]
MVRKVGFLNTETNEVLLYRIMDIEMKQSFLQKLINVGTVLLHASDQTTAMLELINIKKPTDIKRYLSRLIETVRDEKKHHR